MTGPHEIRDESGSCSARPRVAQSKTTAARRSETAADGSDQSDASDRPDFIQKAPFVQKPDYADLFEHAPVGYMLLDPSGCIETINRTGAAILGWDPSWLLGKRFSRWVTNHHQQDFHNYQQQVQGCEDCVRLELFVKNRQGRTVGLRLDSVRETGWHPGAAGCRSVMIDISGEMKLARKLRRLQAQLNRLERLNTIGELASKLAHELNQPLGAVVLSCETALRLLHQGAGREHEFAEALTQAGEAASFASEVVRRLRGFLRNDDEIHTICELGALIQDISTLITVDARDDGIELELEIEKDLPPVCVDPVQIEQVLLNLAHNSIEAMRENGGACNRVLIRAARESPRQILVSVADTGAGLSARQLNRLFTPFYTTKSNGMGLGLSISRTIIEAHGGRLWPVAGVGGGATIHFTLPAAVSGRHAD